MPKTLQQVKTRPPSPTAIRVKGYLDKKVDAKAPYYEQWELADILKVCRHSMRKLRSVPELAGYFKEVTSKRVIWSTPEHIKKL